MKVCVKCRQDKPLTCFHKSKSKVDGLQIYCKDCRKEIDAKSYKSSQTRQQAIKCRRDKNRAYNSELIYRYKRFCKCRVCKESEPVALDLHHIDQSTKDFNPSSGVCYSVDVLRAEIRKCVVLCSNCHRKFHAGLLQY